MVGLEDEPWWKETGLKLRQCFHESECVKGRVVSLCDRLWISLISLSRGVMGLREAHRSLIFCPDFPISSAVGIRSRDIWKFWFYICNHVNCYLQIGHTSTLYAVGSQQEGDAQCWAGFVHLETMSPKGTQTASVPEALGHQGVLQIPPLKLAHISWTLISPEHSWGAETERSAEPP